MTIMISTAYAASGTVLGVVTDASSGAAIPGPHMKIYNASKSYGPINRDSSGFYMFTVTTGSYTLRAAAVGYGTQTRSVTLSTDEIEVQHFQLQRLQSGSMASLEGNNANTPDLQENTIQILQDVKDQIATMDPAAFKTPEKQNTLIARYDAVIREVQEGRYYLALRKLHYGIVIRINGCNRLGRSDGNDWITDCEAQRSIYDSTEEVRELIARFDSN